MTATAFYAPVPITFEVSTKRKAYKPQDDAKTTAAATGSAQAAALAAYSGLATQCGAAASVINQYQLGPYGTNGSCTYDCSYDQTWWWKADYRYVNANLVQSSAMLNMSAAYNNAFQPTATWLNTALPGYSTTIVDNFSAITALDAAIIAAGGNETPEQAAALNAAFGNINAALAANLSQADNGLQSLAVFANGQNQYNGYLKNTAGIYQTNIKADAVKTENNLIGQISCGADDVRATFNNMFADIDAKFAAMQPSFTAVNTAFQAALQAVALVAGVFISLQSKSGLVSEFTAKAQSFPPVSPLRQMYINMALEDWTNFTTEANTQFTG